MSRDFDCRAEAEAAMRLAAAATCEHDPLKWLRVVQVWQDLANARSDCRWLNHRAPVAIIPATTPSLKPERVQPGDAASIIAQDN
jgi:hypothetical protein